MPPSIFPPPSSACRCLEKEGRRHADARVPAYDGGPGPGNVVILVDVFKQVSLDFGGSHRTFEGQWRRFTLGGRLLTTYKMLPPIKPHSPIICWQLMPSWVMANMGKSATTTSISVLYAAAWRPYKACRAGSQRTRRRSCVTISPLSHTGVGRHAPTLNVGVPYLLDWDPDCDGDTTQGPRDGAQHGRIAVITHGL